MTPADVAAYIGAAAWLPQIGTWLWHRFTAPQVTIVAAPSVELGFTRFGPIFNIRLAFSVEQQDAIVDGLDVRIRHMDGEERLLRWAGMSEHLSEITDSAGNRQLVSREQAPIAFQIGQRGLLEKFVRFQEPRFWERTRAPFEAFLGHASFLRQQGGEFVPKLLESKELHELIETHKAAFWWRAGRWIVAFEMRSPTKVSVKKHSYEFELSELNVENLKGSIALLKQEFQSIIRSAEPEYQQQPVSWRWVNAQLERKNQKASKLGARTGG